MGSSDRVALLAGHAAFDSDDALLLAATAAVAACVSSFMGTTTDDVLSSAMDTAADPGTALMLAAGPVTVPYELSTPPLDLDRMERLARAVPHDDRPTVLSFTESLLSQSDPRQAWQLICHVLGAEAAVQHALGLDIAAHLDLEHAAHWQPGVPLPSALARQLIADQTARAAVAGHVHGLGDPRLAGLLADPHDSAMTPAQARVLAVAGAAADPGRAVDVATHLLHHFSVQALDESLRLVARIATRAGFGEEIAAQARAEGFVTEQSAWAVAAARAGALIGVELVDLVSQLGPRVEAELDPGRELVAGLPLIEALLQVGAVDDAVTWAARWRLPVTVLVRRCLYAGLSAGAGMLATHPSLGTLVAPTIQSDERVVPNWRDDRGAWWQPQGAEPSERLNALRDMLTVVARTPWRVVPGSLADLLGVEG